MKIEIGDNLSFILLCIIILIVVCFICNTTHAKGIDRKTWDKGHYVLHFAGHQGLTNILKVSNVNAALICFGAGYLNELFDEMSKQGFIDKNGVLFDPYYGFDKYDLIRNITGIGSSWLFNKFVLSRFKKPVIKVKIQIMRGIKCLK